MQKPVFTGTTLTAGDYSDRNAQLWTTPAPRDPPPKLPNDRFKFGKRVGI
jgi:hypothetical protein